jgi:hypothetical protein
MSEEKVEFTALIGKFVMTAEEFHDELLKAGYVTRSEALRAVIDGLGELHRTERLKVFTNSKDRRHNRIIARDQEDAQALAGEDYGEWTEVPPWVRIKILFEGGDGGLTVHAVTRTAAEWAARGRGWLLSYED